MTLLGLVAHKAGGKAPPAFFKEKAMLKIRLQYDSSVESPNKKDGWKLISFITRHQAYQNPESLEFSVPEKIKTGHAYYLSYFEGKEAWWGLSGDLPPKGIKVKYDGIRMNGLVVWEGKGDPPEEESAQEFLQEYTRWANGECYTYEILNEEDKVVKFGQGIIGRDRVMKTIQEATEGKKSAIIDLSKREWR